MVECVKGVHIFQLTPDLLIKKGTRINMPVYASHHTPEFFPEPEKFRPERFLKENVGDIIPFTYRPFGGNHWGSLRMYNYRQQFYSHRWTPAVYRSKVCHG